MLNGLPHTCGLILEVVKRKEGQKGFEVLPRRWVVERTFGWFGRYRRLSKDYEYLPTTSEIMIKVAMINLMLRRLTSENLAIAQWQAPPDRNRVVKLFKHALR